MNYFLDQCAGLFRFHRVYRLLGFFQTRQHIVKQSLQNEHPNIVSLNGPVPCLWSRRAGQYLLANVYVHLPLKVMVL